jgi:ketosteroid isomerase-like protein
MNQTDENTIKEVIQKIFANWSLMSADKNDPLYEADDQTILFDIGTMIDVGWSTQKVRLRTAFAGLESFEIIPSNDLSVRTYGDFSWAACTWQAKGKPRSGEAFKLNGRGTFVLIKKEGRWLAVHDHMSVPAGT